MNKQSIGSVIILGGIAFIGFIWFKRNKPTIADKQLADLTAQSNAINAGSVESIDKPFEYSQETINNAGSNPYTNSTFTMGNLNAQQIKDIKAVVGNVPSVENMLFGQMSQNLQNIDFSQLENLNLANVDWSNLDWSNIKIK